MKMKLVAAAVCGLFSQTVLAGELQCSVHELSIIADSSYDIGALKQFVESSDNLTDTSRSLTRWDSHRLSNYASQASQFNSRFHLRIQTDETTASVTITSLFLG